MLIVGLMLPWQVGDKIKGIAIKRIDINPAFTYRLDSLNLAVTVGIAYSYASVWLEKPACVDAYAIKQGPMSGVATIQLGELKMDADSEGWNNKWDLTEFDSDCVWVNFNDRGVDNENQADTYKSDVYLFGAKLTYFFNYSTCVIKVPEGTFFYERSNR